MRCPLCRQIYVRELYFSTLFSPDRLCPECQRIMDAEYFEELIPLAGGSIRYRYLIDQPKAEYDSYLSYSYTFAKTLDLAVSHDLIIMIEDQEITAFSGWFPLIKAFGSILMVSVIRFEFAYLIGENQ
ncbi:MAG: hypothetical protein ACOX16_03685 [Candidatus Izemoplasmatales bacterium]|jgi:hypothetical protein